MKQGFTLIELLAVIVILAIIALIATPIVINIIRDSKENAQLRSAEMYLDAVEQAVMKEKMTNTTFKPNRCEIKDKKLYCNESTDELVVEVNGEKPNNGYITFTEGKIYEVTLDYANKTVIKNNEGNLVYVTHNNGKVVYFDVKKGVGCTEKEYKSSYDSTTGDYLNSKTGYNGITTTSELQNSCLKFYAFNDNRGDILNLLLDHNTTTFVYWNSSYSNASGPKELLTQLASDTSSWTGTETPTNYSIDQSSVTSKAKYTIDYTGYKARIITAEEIAQITGNISWDVTIESSTYFYFDSLTTAQSATCKEGNTSGCQFGWLYDRIAPECIDYGCLNNSDVETSGYWTISSSASDSGSAWFIDASSYLYSLSVGWDFFGVRPVIEVLKSKLN